MREQFFLELRLLVRTRHFAILAGVLLVLAILSGGQGGQLARTQTDAIETARAHGLQHDAEALAKADTIRAGEINPPWWLNPLNAQAWSYAMIRHVALPPKALAGVAIGEADILPFLFRINPHPPDRWSNRASELTPSVAAYGGFGLVDVILILTPLIIIVAFADVIRDRDGSERQRLAVVQAASEQTLLVRRLLPRAILTLLIILLAALIGIVSTFPPASGEVPCGALVILLQFGGHALFWMMVAGVLVLTLRTAVVTFSGFISLWFFLGILAPVVIDGTARYITPPPSPLVVFAKERAEIVRARMQEEELTRAYAMQDPLARDMLLDALQKHQILITPTNLLIQQEVDRRRAEARQDEHTARHQFISQVRALSALSPTLSARKAVHIRAGRDAGRHAAFMAQAETYHRELQKVFTPHLMRRATLDGVLLPTPFEFYEPGR